MFVSVCCSLSAFAFPVCLLCLCLRFDNFLLSLVCARVCFVPSMLLLKFFSLFVSCVCLLVCLLVCSFARLLVRLLLCMHLCLFVACSYASLFCLCFVLSRSPFVCVCGRSVWLGFAFDGAWPLLSRVTSVISHGRLVTSAL